ncbi:peptidase S8 [Raphidocelis subcapitata]|uniref:Peptidase S8 n=1 Tax=Raphidocelis subcapitata TaxID=307507 RepID=A0A2V0NP06_9CHLO|nr:peptidase S8 [Raphidocelis subcapitata]|eukprot:GBF89324.1 peptidase S8 [Raphidocelis subcapitata]
MRKLLAAALVLAQLATTLASIEPHPIGSTAAASPRAAALSAGRRAAAAAAAALSASPTAKRPVDYVVSFKIDQSDIDSHESAIAAAQSARAASASASAAPRTPSAVRAEARLRAQSAVKERVLASGAAAAQGGTRLARDFRRLPVSLVSVDTPEALEALRSDPSVLSVEPRRQYTVQGRDLGLGLSRRGRQLLIAESLPLIDQPAAAAAGFTGQGCNVAVLDTGANWRHKHLGSCTAVGTPAATCRVMFAADFPLGQYDDGELDDMDHGSNVAAVIAQAAPGVNIIALDVFRKFNDGPGTEDYWGADDADLLAAVSWILENKESKKICVINMSLGASCMEGSEYVPCGPCPGHALAVAIQTARDAGVLTAAASGNDMFTTGLASPACAPAAVSVGAVYDAPHVGISWGNPPDDCTDANIVTDQIACFSNSASFLTVLAPGALIWAGGTQLGGTSQATPHVAATLAVLRAAAPTATNEEIIDALSTTGKEITDPRNGVKTRRISMMAALTKLLGGNGGGTPGGTVQINGGAAWAASQAVTLSVNATGGATQMCVASEATAACAPYEAVSASKAWQLPAGDGAKSVFVYFKNVLGAVSPSPATATITLDATAPSGEALSIDGGAQSTSSPQVTLAISGTDNNPAGLQMCLSNAQTTAAGCTPYEAFAATKAHTLSAGAGSKTVFLWLRDAAGNAASAQAQITLLVVPSGTVAINGGAAWTNTPSVTLNITAGEGATEACVANTAVGAADCSPYEAAAVSKAWQLPAGDGEKGVFVYFKNAAGETGGPATATIKLDATAPAEASLAINGGAEWATATGATLTIGGSDNNPAGLQMCLSNAQTTAEACSPYEAFAASKQWQLPAGEGDRTVFLWLRDAAGNSVGASASIKLDTQAPRSVGVSINDGAAETASLDVSVAITASDFSGVASMCIKAAAGARCGEGDFVAFASPAAVALPAGAMGARFVYVTLRDARGNTMSSAASDQITYNDPTVPSDVSVSIANANSGGWVTSRDVRIAVSGAGAASVTQICVREDASACTTFSPFTNPMPYLLTSPTDGQQTLYVTLRGGAASGAASAAQSGAGLPVSVPMSVDLNPPTDARISVSGGSGVAAGPYLSLAVAATDVSGVKEVCITDEPGATAASCQPWRPYSTAQSFTLASAEGTSKVLAFFRDGNDHVSSGVAANVTIDKSKPKAKKRDMDLKATASSSSITLTWSKDGATDDVSNVASFFVLYRANYTPNSCKSKRKRTKVVNASIGADGTVTAVVKGLKPGKRYGFRCCAVDAAGNVGGGVTQHARTQRGGR